MRRTKIIATLGPATESPDLLGRLLDAGLDIARLNMSHATHDWVRRVVADLRAAAAARGRHVGILLDTQGPAIRTGDLAVPLDLTPGQTLTLTVRGERSEEEHSVDVNYENFVNDISVGDVVVVDNGSIHLRVLAKHENKVDCEVLTPGKLGSRRHINLPGVRVSLPALTAKDMADIAVGLEVGVDFIALSFVREARDMLQLRAVVEPAARRPLLIAKLEDQQAVANLDAIIDASDGLMIARGDLGIEVPYEELPIIQRRVVKHCLRVGKPVIVATHLLESMIQNPLPTRAEVTDVANAVFEQADAIMLSGETTVGRYPLRCLEVMDRVARRIERSGGANFHHAAALSLPRQKLVKSAVVMADELKAPAILVFTAKGNIPRYAAWMRPHYATIFAACDNQAIADQLTLPWGVRPFVVPFTMVQPQRAIEPAIEALLARGWIQKGATLVVICPVAVGGQLVEAVQMRQV